MELLDRYLNAVRGYLPDAQKDDIIKELSENLRSQVEDKEAELGRPLTDSDIEAILKQHGHPIIVAGRYRQDHRSFSFGGQLIGPELFPFYAKVLIFNLGITGVVLLVIFTALFASGQPVTIPGILSVFLYQLLFQFGTVTLIFALMDKQFSKFPNHWNPQNPNYPYYVNLAFLKDTQSVPRMESISQLIALSVSIVWLRALQQSPFWLLGPAAAFLKLAPVWRQFYLPVVLLALAGMTQAGVNLVRPDWVRVRSIGHVVLSAGMFAIWVLLLRAGSWIVPVDAPANVATNYHRSIEIVNQCFFYGLLLAVVISGFQLLRSLRALTRGTSIGGATSPASKAS